ncbi:hypothetical protein [Bradyrhizobium cenepequi]|uniref:hypothetical protein n=1 Tax=Bradyrhizobium cenepequi TaxID=2821403 RepID=UPI001CE28B32|nr:hypothetical protein [Bradyrhizobium cenepequi]
MTMISAMLAATAAAIENLTPTLSSARLPELRSTDGTSMGSIASCMAWATALVNISELSRRRGLPSGLVPTT